MKAIINRGEQFGMLNGVIMKNSEVLHVILKHLMQGTAKKIIDTDITLMYILKAEK